MSSKKNRKRRADRQHETAIDVALRSGKQAEDLSRAGPPPPPPPLMKEKPKKANTQPHPRMRREIANLRDRPWDDETKKKVGARLRPMMEWNAPMLSMQRSSGATAASIMRFRETYDPLVLVRDDEFVAWNRVLRAEGMGQVQKSINGGASIKRTRGG